MERVPESPAGFLKTYQLFIALITLVVIALSVTGFEWAQKRVTVVVDGEPRFLKSQADTVGALLEQAGIEVSDGDVVSPPLDSRLADGDTVVVRYAIPVTLLLGDQRLALDVVGSTVADALTAAGVAPDAGLDVDPPLETALFPGLTISARNAFVRIAEETAEIPFDVETKNDPTRNFGSRVIVSKGVPGKASRIYRIIIVDGVASNRTLVSERVIREPVNEVVAVGTQRVTRSVSRAGSMRAVTASPDAGDKLTVIATAYAPGVGGVGTRTAVGGRARYGVVAVDPRVIPLGTRLYIPGYGYGVAADTGGAIKGKKIDVCFDTGAEAIAWGRRTVTITILP